MTSAPVLGVTVLGFSMPLSVIALGVFSGISYGLLAVGMVLIYRTSRIVNFALSQTGILGAAVLGLLVERRHLPYYTALPLALGAGGAASGAIELLVVRRLHNAPRVMSVVATLGAGAFIADFSFALNPASTSSSAIPSPPGMPTFDIGALLVNQGYSALLVLGPIAVALVTLFLRYSRTGLGIRCASANPEAARMAGISVNRMSSVAWIVAGVLAALTAILVIPASGFVQATSFGPSLLLRALAAGVLARMYSFPVAFLRSAG